MRQPFPYLRRMSEQTHTDPAAPADDHAAPTTPDDLMSAAAARIAALEAERDDYKDRWMRAEAEMANVRARARREVEETRQYAVQKFARDVAEAADNLKRGLDSAPAAGSGDPDLMRKLLEGFAGVERSFLALLERNGIMRQDPTGASFDPELHQAMAEQDTHEHPPGTVIQAWTPAWTLNGRLLRPAMVVVAKTPAGAGSGPSTGPAASEPSVRLDTTA